MQLRQNGTPQENDARIALDAPPHLRMAMAWQGMRRRKIISFQVGMPAS